MTFLRQFLVSSFKFLHRIVTSEFRTHFIDILYLIFCSFQCFFMNVLMHFILILITRVIMENNDLK